MSEIGTKLKASPKLSAWIKAQIKSAAKYIPGKGGVCNFCGRFCRTNHTDSKTGTRSHYCQQCGISFQTRGGGAVGKSPDKFDTAEPARVELDRAQVKKTPLKSKAKTGKKR